VFVSDPGDEMKPIEKKNQELCNNDWNLSMEA
jgi:hypothetical protein